ncbi:MAG: hypothetical protein HY094_06670 [Candidatus Melainabacteria bacterium]|nr:hypothetical protein [Candidatus Melainabacteria bacterium]
MGIGNVSLSIVRTAVTAMFDAMGSTFPKAAVACLEDKSQDPVHLARQCLIDEGFEVFWKTAVGSLFVKATRSVAPFIPEQFANMPGEMLGALIHWWSASDQSKNNETVKIVNGDKSGPDFLQSAFNNYLKPVISSTLKAVGLDESKENNKENNKENTDLVKFAAFQAALMTGGALILKGAEDENIPGMNMNPEDSAWKTFLKITGYTVLEQTTHLASQSMRYYEDFKKEFSMQDSKSLNKDILGKAIANAVHERFIPGNIFSAISGCLSTLWLGKYVPKSIAGAIGEAPMKGLERLLTLHLRRSTKQRFDLKTGKVIDNYRIKEMPWFEQVSKIADFIFNPIRNFFIEKVVARVFKPENMTVVEYSKILRASFNIDKKLLEERAKIEEAKESKGKLQDANTSHATTLSPAPAAS